MGIIFIADMVRISIKYFNYQMNQANIVIHFSKISLGGTRRACKSAGMGSIFFADVVRISIKYCNYQMNQANIGIR